MDVNGWSFVKGNDAYYAKCSRVLRDMCLRAIKRGGRLPLDDYLSGDDLVDC